MKWHTQAVNITTDHKVKVDFNLPTLIATNVGIWKFHMVDSTKGIYNIILGQGILKLLGSTLKLSEHVIKTYNGTFKGSTKPMVDLGAYTFKYLNTGKITPKE